MAVLGFLLLLQNTMTISSSRRRGFIYFQFHIRVHRKMKSGEKTSLKQGSKVEAGAAAMAVEECYLLACSHQLDQPVYF